MTSNRHTIKEEVYNSIKNNFGEKILKSIEDYDVSLTITDAINLVEYEESLNEALSSDNIQIKGRYIKLVTNKEKQILINQIKKELTSLNTLKKRLGRKYYEENNNSY